LSQAAIGALVLVASRDQLGEPRGVGERGDGPGVGAQLRGRTAQAGRIGTQRLSHAVDHVQRIVGAPHECQVMQFGHRALQQVIVQRAEQAGRGGDVGAAVGVRGEHQGLERAQGEGVQSVQCALYRRAHRQPAGERGQVGRRGQRQIRTAPQQRGELGVLARPQPVRQRRGRVPVRRI
jgi:hypothetical protein